MKAYERVDETGRAQTAAQTAAVKAAERAADGWAQSTMLADGRLRISVLDVRGIITEVRYVAGDGETEVEC